MHFRFYPGLRKQFDLNRRKHPRVAEAVFRFNANVADANNLMQLLNETGCETLSTFHLRQLRMSFLQAIEDVMFDEATEALIADCAMVFDELLATLRASRREESPQDGPRTQ
ncbi:MAG: hypothetical protein KDJ38_06935 [Gammaproteobacteria bacterium]|nr:hypothetical protein [Gammaproteobacteria bacterium]